LVALVWRAARALGRDPVVPALAVGLHPLVLCHVVAGAHNEALVVLVMLGGVVLWLVGLPRGGVALATLGAGIKASAGIVVPFLALARRPQARLVAVAAGVLVAIGLVALIGFGTHALDAFKLISSNQDPTSRWSLPYKTAQLLGALLPGDRHDYSDAVRAVYGAAFAAVFLWLVWRAWLGRIAAIDAAAWA